MDILNAIVGLLLEIINTVLQPILEQLAVIGFRESVVQFMLINAVLGLSIYLTLNTGLLSLANAGFMAIGAYVSVVLTMEGDLSFGLALICGALAAGLVAIPIGLPVLRLRNIYLAIATIGFGEIVRIVILNFDGLATSLLGPDEPYDFTHGARGINRIPKLTETAHLVLILLQELDSLFNRLPHVPIRDFAHYGGTGQCDRYGRHDRNLDSALHNGFPSPGLTPVVTNILGFQS